MLSRCVSWLLWCEGGELMGIQWAIGTVLRDGDECLIVSVMETDTKCAFRFAFVRGC